MFVITLRYIVDLARIDAALDAHARWLDAQYADGVFLASGRQVPRVGGVILAAGLTRDEMDERLALDPLRQQGLAEYIVVEFVPSRTAGGLDRFLT
jgi:uncharacterized protein YciI